MLYFTLLVLFLVLIIGPIIVRRFITDLPKIPLDLQQPTGQNNNDTFASVTGSVLVPGLGDGGATATGGGGGGGGSTATASAGGEAFPSDAFGLGGGNRFVRW
jgi:1,3-beta-glucan synthase